MNELVPNEEQKWMLKQMLRGLFKDWISKEDNPIDKMGVICDRLSNTCFVYLKEDDGTKRVQWFEFCVFYIQPKLSYYMSTMIIRTLGTKFIDSLYKKYKEHAYIERIQADKPH